MNTRNLITGWIILTMIFPLTIQAQTIEQDSLTMGPGYSNHIYYSFQDGQVHSSVANDWDIAFRADKFTSTIRINGGQGVKLYALAGDETAFNSNVDTNGLFPSLSQLYDSDETWNYGAFENNPVGQFNYGWGSYNTTTHVVSATRAFLIEATDGSVKKIVIDELQSGVWKFRFSDLDGSNLVQDSINVDDYPDKYFIGYSLVSDEVKDFDADATTWDIVFTKFMTADYNGTPWQAVTGILTHEGAEVASVEGMSYEDAMASNYTLTPDNISAIGWDWKSLNYQTFQWELADSLSYFIKAGNGDIYQFWVTDFAGSASGNVKFNYRKEELTSGIDEFGQTLAKYNVYPNPNSGQFNILYDFNEAVSNARFELYDLSGRLLHTQELFTNVGLNTQSVNVGHLSLPTGMYQTVLRTNTIVAQDKLMINR